MESDGFTIVHPDRGGGPIAYDLQTGANADEAVYPESAWIRCKKCRQILNRKRHPKGWEEGNTQASTQLNGAVTAGDVTITVDSTTGFDSSGYVYIYDTGSSGHGMNKVTYTGTGATTFTGCTGATAHEDGMWVRGERKATGGCPHCGTYNYD